ncbi:MAG: ChbG/HpnK family deacetylase [Pikeienuella sp.]
MTIAAAELRQNDATPPNWGVRVCADDFGLSEAVNQGILALVRLGRLDGVSCMAGGAAFVQGAPALLEAVAAAPCKVEIGVHLTLSEFAPLGPMPRTAPEHCLPGIGTMLVRGVLGRLDGAEIGDELTRQVRRFREVLGRPPDFIDGHQHVHLVPGVSGVIAACREIWGAGTPWIRSCGCPTADLLRLPTDRAKAGFLAALSVRSSRPGGIPTNPAFYGVNSFSVGEDFGALMRGWLRLAAARPSGALIMVHPGLAPNGAGGPRDVIAARRPQEFAYLAGDGFAQDRRQVSTQLRPQTADAG